MTLTNLSNHWESSYFSSRRDVTVLSVFSVLYYAAVFILPTTFSIKLSLSQLFVYAAWAGLFYALCLRSIDLFFIHRRESRFGLTDGKLFAKIVILSILAGIILEACTLFGSVGGSVFNHADWGIKRIALFCLWSFSALILYINLAKDGFVGYLKRGVTWLWTFISRFDAQAVIFISIVALATAAFLHLSFNLAFISVFLFCCAVAVSVFSLAQRGRMTLHLETAFLVVALSFGVFLSTQIPAMTGISWDDQIHYRNALSLSYITAPERTDEEFDMEYMAVYRAEGREVGIDITEWDSEEIDAFYESINDGYSKDIDGQHLSRRYDSSQLFSFNSLGYIPSAIGLWLGRLLHLPYNVIVIFGRLGNVISYCLVCYFAIKITPVKKVVFTVVALLPTNLFLASSYSYDPWLVSYLMLAVAMLLREMWGRTEKLSFVRLLAPTFVMFVGLCVKAVYFPIIGIYFLMPRDKFASSSQRRRYYSLVVAFGFFMLASFALPYLFTVESDTGDVRGGTGLDPMGQIVYILSHPIRYAQTLFEFFFEHYFNPSVSSGYTLFFAYLSNSEASATARYLFNHIDVLFLVLVAVLDGMDDISRSRSSFAGSVWTFFLAACSFVLVATALYVSFTPVGLDTVNGCQQRYVLPWLAPGLALIFNVGIPFKRQVLLRRSAMLISIIMLSSCVFFDVVTKLVV